MVSSDNKSISDRLQTELVGVAFEQLRLSAVALLVSGLFLGAALWNVSDRRIVTAWVSAVTVINLLRLALAVYYRRRKNSRSTASWKRLFLSGVAVSSLLWGIGAFLLFPQDSPLHQTIMIVVLAGITAGALSSLAPILSAVRIFMFAVLLPLIVRLLMQPEPIYAWLAAMILMFLGLILTVSRKFYLNNLKTIQTRQMYEKAKEALHLSAKRFESIFRDAPAGIFLYDTDLRMVDVNQSLMDILDAPYDFLVGLDLHKIRDKGILPALEAPLNNVDGFYEGPYVTLYRKIEIWISMRTSAVLDSNRNVIGGIGIIEDITARRQDQEKIRYQAYYDALTDVPNRTLLLDHLQQEMIRFRRHGIIAGLLFLDLDHFKNINDSLGHAIGDALLVAAARRLQELLREEDTISRLGGDEFVILLPDLALNPAEAAQKVDTVARKVHTLLSEPFEIAGHRLSTSASIGAVVTDDDNDTCEDLLKHADTAMYQAKKAGRRVTRFYKPEMDRWIQRRLRIDNALRIAAENDMLRLHYQPIVDFADGRIVGAEALLRWRDPELGEVAAEEFVSVAEESGLIVRIGTWVLDEACRQFAAWRQGPCAPFNLERIAVNVSSKQFSDDHFVTATLDALGRHGLKPGQLELELTESIIIDNVEAISKKMQELRYYGIGLSIDDFGTGYSSLSYLKKLPFSTLKIDKSFTHDIQTDLDDAALIRTIITIAFSFDLNVIAEGVETPEQFAFLQGNGCHYYQGYHCSVPLDGAAFSKMLVEQGGRCAGERLQNQL